MRRQNLVQYQVRSKQNSSVKNGVDVFDNRLVDAQLSAVLWNPMLIQVDNQGKHAVVTRFKLVQVGHVKSSWRILRQVKLKSL